MYTCCASVLFTSLFIPKQGLLLPVLILAYYIGLKSRVTNLILEQIVLVFSFLLALLKAINAIGRKKEEEEEENKDTSSTIKEPQRFQSRSNDDDDDHGTFKISVQVSVIVTVHVLTVRRSRIE